MHKILSFSVLVSGLILSASAFAGECVDKNGKDIFNDPDAFQTEIASKEYCFQAVDLAESCAYGSSLDVSTAGIAYDICDGELKKQNPSKEDLTLLSSMKDRCTKKYENEDGTMYRSMNAYCHLSAIEWILNLATPN